MSKSAPLIALGVLAFAGAAIERAMWAGRGPIQFAFVHALLMACAIYWWYHLDKSERQFKAGAFQNISVAGISLVGLPVYFIRSRGWKRGFMATLGALGILIVGGVIAIAGDFVGGRVAF